MHTLLQRRCVSPDLAGDLLVAARTLAARHTLSDRSLPGRIRQVVDDDLGTLAELTAVPDGAPGVLLDGIPVPDPATETPPSWHETVGRVRASRILLLLVAAAVGTPFGWSGQQAGRLVTDLVPTRGEESTQTGAGSTTELTLHTEDAFHPHRATHFLLFGLRNPGGVGTMLSSAADAVSRLTPDQVETLSRPGPPILPDSSYDDAGGAGGRVGRPMSTLWNRSGGHGLRFDPEYTRLDDAPRSWRSAYSALTAALRDSVVEVPVLPGQILVVDNDACVHGRVPFSARHDGTDRWLLRVNVDRPVGDRPVSELDEDGYGQERWSPFAADLVGAVR